MKDYITHLIVYGVTYSGFLFCGIMCAYHYGILRGMRRYRDTFMKVNKDTENLLNHIKNFGWDTSQVKKIDDIQTNLNLMIKD